MVNADFAHTKACVNHYRKVGLCPLPSRMDIKGPMLETYAEHYDAKPVPEEIYSDWATTNVQIITGTQSPSPTKILVVDLDGPEALEAWQKITWQKNHKDDPTWHSVTGSGGHHIYFLLPDGLTECPSGIVWGLYDTWGKTGKGQWVKHKEIRILGDRALVVAPPSKHVETGKRYEFMMPHTPKINRLPAIAPDWLLSMPRLSTPRFTEPPAPRKPVAYTRQSDRYYTREEVLDAVADQKFDIACREWGLVSACSGPNPAGWCSCFVPGREDARYAKPSGSFHFRDGTFQDLKDKTAISMFDLAVVLGVFATWQEARDSLGDRFIGKRVAEPKYKFAY
ncbi:Bifunctional DNA primase/polymerase, N-terminal [Singulisphaera sp. GP187]|uniref:bifunctional DNA primase/polymerase n=1 Tax=Singulisphaera sp. GP187 TaxID=1882752 RepID=UPI00092A2817|nr:bifunctional DNA primase/polymerase [Singulisphaera sp. GP187]SIO37814.1 Bifunctional DNA primase/polymerase, N-terminal [Singulisphaera sp. GP187]